MRSIGKKGPKIDLSAINIDAVATVTGIPPSTIKRVLAVIRKHPRLSKFPTKVPPKGYIRLQDAARKYGIPAMTLSSAHKRGSLCGIIKEPNRIYLLETAVAEFSSSRRRYKKRRKTKLQ